MFLYGLGVVVEENVTPRLGSKLGALAIDVLIGSTRHFNAQRYGRNVAEAEMDSSQNAGLGVLHIGLDKRVLSAGLVSKRVVMV